MEGVQRVAGLVLQLPSFPLLEMSPTLAADTVEYAEAKLFAVLELLIKIQLESGKPAVYEDAYVAGMGISELGMTVYPTGVFYVLALPLQVDQFQRIDGVFRCRLMSSVLLQSSDSGERLNPPPRSPLSLCSSLWLCLEIGSFNRIILGADCKQSYDSSLGQNQVAPITLFVFYFSLFRISRSFLCHRFRSVCLWLL